MNELFQKHTRGRATAFHEHDHFQMLAYIKPKENDQAKNTSYLNSNIHFCP